VTEVRTEEPVIIDLYALCRRLRFNVMFDCALVVYLVIDYCFFINVAFFHDI